MADILFIICFFLTCAGHWKKQTVTFILTSTIKVLCFLRDTVFDVLLSLKWTDNSVFGPWDIPLPGRF